MKKRKKKKVIKNENHEHKTFIQFEMQSDHDRDTYNINNKLIKLISSNEIIKKKLFIHKVFE